MVSLATCIVFGEMSVQSLCSFFKFGYRSLYYWILRVLYLFWMQVLYCIYDFQIFSSIYFLEGVFWGTKTFNFNEVQSIFFVAYTFDVICKKLSPNSRSQRLTLRFPSNSYLSFVLIFKIHFKLIFVNGVR